MFYYSQVFACFLNQLISYLSGISSIYSAEITALSFWLYEEEWPAESTKWSCPTAGHWWDHS